MGLGPRGRSLLRRHLGHHSDGIPPPVPVVVLGWQLVRHLPAIQHGRPVLFLCSRRWRGSVDDPLDVGHVRRASPAAVRADALGSRHDHPLGRFVVLVVQRADVVVRPGAQKHEALGLEGLLAPVVVVLPDIAHRPGRRRAHPALPCRLPQIPAAAAAVATAATSLVRVRRIPLELLLRLEALLGRELGHGAALVHEGGELVALGREVVLDVAGGLVRVEPAPAVVVPLPAGREPGRHLSRRGPPSSFFPFLP